MCLSGQRCWEWGQKAPEVGGGGHNCLGQRGKEEERSTPLCLDLPDNQCKGAAAVAHVQTQAGEQAGEL